MNKDKKGYLLMLESAMNIMETYRRKVNKESTYSERKKVFDKSMKLCNSDLNDSVHNNGVYITTIKDKNHAQHSSQFYVSKVDDENFAVIEYKLVNIVGRIDIEEVKMILNKGGVKIKVILNVKEIDVINWEKLPKGYKGLLEDSLK